MHIVYIDRFVCIHVSIDQSTFWKCFLTLSCRPSDINMDKLNF